MAKLVTTKEKYGVSVATRLDPNLAHQIAAKAERLGITMSKMIGMLITNTINPVDSESAINQDPHKMSFQQVYSRCATGTPAIK